MARETHVSVRFESQDKVLIQVCASSVGFSISEWIRQVCLQVAHQQSHAQQLVRMEVDGVEIPEVIKTIRSFELEPLPPDWPSRGRQ